MEDGVTTASLATTRAPRLEDCFGHLAVAELPALYDHLDDLALAAFVQEEHDTAQLRAHYSVNFIGIFLDALFSGTESRLSELDDVPQE